MPPKPQAVVTTSDNLLQSSVSPEYLQAIQGIRDRKVPARSIRTRPGRGGKTLQYIDHAHATRVIQDALQHFWSFEGAVSYEIFDGTPMSVLTVNRLSMHIPILQPDGSTTFLTRVVQETGVFLNDMKIPKAPAVAASVSRGLCRCLARMLGYGLEFYEQDQPEITAKDAWNILWTFAQNQGQKDKDAVVAALKTKGITSAELADRFEEAWAIVSELVGSKVVAEEVPEGL